VEVEPFALAQERHKVVVETTSEARAWVLHVSSAATVAELVQTVYLKGYRQLILQKTQDYTRWGGRLATQQ
jgi:hypothetical protein